MMTARKRPDGTYDLPVGRGHIGAEVLEIISGALYTNPLDVVREYIQNAVDGRATDVRIEVRDDEVVISDNGRGMDLSELDEARKIAISRKRKDTQVGFRGIGIYSSFSVCDRLEIVTRPAAGHDAYRLQFMYGDIRSQIEKAREGLIDPVSLMDVLDQYTHISDAPAGVARGNPSGSFTRVRLSNPTQRFNSRVGQVDALSAYLVSTVPLDFSDDFEHAATVREAIATNVPEFNLIRVVVKVGDDPDQLIVQPAVEDLIPPTIRLLTDPNTGSPVALIWACLNRERRGIKPAHVQGFLVRVKGFAIGDRQFARQFWGRRGYGVLYPWYTGEVYVLDGSITPTAERNDFEESAAKERLYELLRHEFGRLERAADKRREALVDVQKLSRGAKPSSDLPEVLRRLEEAGQELDTSAALKPDELLDEKGARVTSLGAPMTPPSSQRAPVGVGLAQPEKEATEATAVDEESIAQMLYSLPIQWPQDTREVVDIVDETLQEDLEPVKYRQCARDVRKKLETWEQDGDAE
ncbi:MAG: ATP-binding protein [Dehalococcoidia bacterium]|nr:ATP-binding protein [Dehalococcoidia bacterium]